MADYNITMKQLNSSGTYDTLYPATIGSQVSGIYTAEQTLTSNTAALYQLGSSAVPDDVLKVLARFQTGIGNEYIWEKVKYSYDLYFESYPSSVYRKEINDSVTYYTEISLNGDQIELADSHAIVLSSSSVAQSLVGNYVIADESFAGAIIKIESVQQSSSNLQFRGSFAEVKTSVEEFSYVNSPNKNAYPPQTDDGYSYIGPKALGSFGSVELVNYTGTGTGGPDNPCAIRFSFKPTLVYLYAAKPQSSSVISPTFTATTTGVYMIDISEYTNQFSPSRGFMGHTTTSVSALYAFNYGKFDDSSNELSWYNNFADISSRPGNQLNWFGTTYYIIAVKGE